MDFQKCSKFCCTHLRKSHLFLRFQWCFPYFHICSGEQEMEVADFLVYMLFLSIPWTYLDVRYVIRKVFSKGIQRNWNRGKRFSGGEVIRRVLYWNSLLKYVETWVMIRPSLISFITLLPQYGFWPNLVPTDSYDEGGSDGAGCKKFGGKLIKDIGFYQRINYLALIRIISAFCFRWGLHFTGPLFCTPKVFLQF